MIAAHTLSRTVLGVFPLGGTIARERRRGIGPKGRAKPSPKVCMFIFNFVRVKNEISRSSSQMSTRARGRESSVVSPCRGFPWSTSCWSSFSQHVYPCSDQAQLQQSLKEAAHEPGEHFLQSDNGVHTTHKHTPTPTHTHTNTRVCVSGGEVHRIILDYTAVGACERQINRRAVQGVLEQLVLLH